MSYLKARERASLPKSSFALPSHAPGSGSYPINDPAHARAALSRAAANATPSELETIKRKVHEKYPSIKQSK
jgi:hypothetical protein